MTQRFSDMSRRHVLRLTAALTPVLLTGIGRTAWAQSAALNEALADAGATKRFTPSGGGDLDGSTWPNAMPLGWLSKSLALAEPNAAFLIGIDPRQGEPEKFGRDRQVFLKISGTPDNPLLILAGVPNGTTETSARDGTEPHPMFIGSPSWTRETYGKQKGAPCFIAVERGASNLVIGGFSFANSSGDGFIKFRIGKGRPATFTAVRVAGLTGEMIGRAIETDKGASLEDFVLEDCSAIGIVRGFARFRDLRRATLRRLELDAGGLDIGVKNPCQLIAIESGDDITIEDTVLKNAISSQEGHYVQGDGIVCERKTSNLTLRRCHGSGMGDAAFDLKTTNVTMEDCSTEDCKFGARLWTHSQNVIKKCSFKNPVKRGGNSGACVQASGNLEIVDSTFQAGKGASAIALHMLKGGKPPFVRMSGGSIQLDDGAALATTNGKATLELKDVVVNGETRNGTFELDRNALR